MRPSFPDTSSNAGPRSGRTPEISGVRARRATPRGPARDPFGDRKCGKTGTTRIASSAYRRIGPLALIRTRKCTLGVAVDVAEFDFELPPEAIAQRPAPRGTARLMTLDRRRAPSRTGPSPTSPASSAPATSSSSTTRRSSPRGSSGGTRRAAGRSSCWWRESEEKRRFLRMLKRERKRRERRFFEWSRALALPRQAGEAGEDRGEDSSSKVDGRPWRSPPRRPSVRGLRLFTF